MPAPVGCDPIRLPAGPRFNGSNPAAFLKTADRAIQRSRAEPNAREGLDVFHDGVPVLIAVGQARENENRWIRHSYYALRYNVRRNSPPVKPVVAGFLPYHRVFWSAADSASFDRGLSRAVLRFPSNSSTWKEHSSFQFH